MIYFQVFFSKSEIYEEYIFNFFSKSEIYAMAQVQTSITRVIKLVSEVDARGEIELCLSGNEGVANGKASVVKGHRQFIVVVTQVI